ncbi:MAG TPA: TadE/TadG family type IV pilus assembly protein [Microvirga sp.]|nr:TadE/TadG family type IV pilus assembly protein [Microvirga sp.]
MLIGSGWTRARHVFANFRRDERGVIAIMTALMMPVLIGFGVLAIDAGRHFNLQTSLQGGADALALAAAAELDGRSDAIERANRAIDNAVVGNNQRFGEGASAINRSNVSVRFLRGLPASDRTNIDAALVTTDPALARLAEVTVNPVTSRNMFAAAASMAQVSQQTNATAVAGFDSASCNITPLFMCNPFEGANPPLHRAARDPSFRLRQIAMKAKGSTYGSGNYGYLEPAAGNGGSAVREALAIDKPKGCYRLEGVELQPGNISSTAEAMNVRFDMYEGNFSGNKNDVAYRPAQNVRKGFGGATCNKPEPDYNPAIRPDLNPGKSLGLPRDNCFYDNSCPTLGATMAGRIGNGEWDFEAYWKRTYGGLAFPNSWSNTNRPSRYEVYRYEIESSDKLLDVATVNATKKEIGGPVCYSGTKPTVEDVDRRVFLGAIIDCNKHATQLNGSSGGVIPVTAYAKFFLTEPMDKNDGTIWAEMIELVEPGRPSAKGIIRDTVQLYR